MAEAFKLTYATMFNPPEELHTRFDEALVKVKAGLGKEYGLIIGGKERFAAEKFEDRNPADTDVVLGVFQKGTAETLSAPGGGSQGISGLEQDEVAGSGGALRKAADLIDERILSSAQPWRWKSARTVWSRWGCGRNR
jgi:1-pyrroline-5-carboxylate dehydrogenase